MQQITKGGGRFSIFWCLLTKSWCLSGRHGLFLPNRHYWAQYRASWLKFYGLWHIGGQTRWPSGPDWPWKVCDWIREGFFFSSSNLFSSHFHFYGCKAFVWFCIQFPGWCFWSWENINKGWGGVELENSIWKICMIVLKGTSACTSTSSCGTVRCCNSVGVQAMKEKTWQDFTGHD